MYNFFVSFLHHIKKPDISFDNGYRQKRMSDQHNFLILNSKFRFVISIAVLFGVSVIKLFVFLFIVRYQLSPKHHLLLVLVVVCLLLSLCPLCAAIIACIQLEIARTLCRYQPLVWVSLHGL